MSLRVMERIAEFLGHISGRLLGTEAGMAAMSRELADARSEAAEARREIGDMSATLKTVLAAVLAQGDQIKTLQAEKAAEEQRDLDQIQAALDANTALLTGGNGGGATTGTGTQDGGASGAGGGVTAGEQAGTDTSAVHLDASDAAAAAQTAGATTPVAGVATTG